MRFPIFNVMATVLMLSGASAAQADNTYGISFNESHAFDSFHEQLNSRNPQDRDALVHIGQTSRCFFAAASSFREHKELLDQGVTKAVNTAVRHFVDGRISPTVPVDNDLRRKALMSELEQQFSGWSVDLDYNVSQIMDPMAVEARLSLGFVLRHSGSPKIELRVPLVTNRTIANRRSDSNSARQRPFAREELLPDDSAANSACEINPDFLEKLGQAVHDKLVPDLQAYAEATKEQQLRQIRALRPVTKPMANFNLDGLTGVPATVNRAD